MHCWLSAGFDAPQVRQSMGTAGNALIDEPKPTPPTMVPASQMCGAARLHDVAVRCVRKLSNIRKFDGYLIHCRLRALARFI
jgi:hypothetical protein